MHALLIFLACAFHFCVTLEISASTYSIMSWKLESGGRLRLKCGMSYFCGCQRMMLEQRERGIAALPTVPGTPAVTCIRGWSLGCAGNPKSMLKAQ